MIKLKDTIKLVITSAPNGYGDTTVESLVDLKCLFNQSTGSTHNQHIDYINSDASAYIDFNNVEVVNRAYRLEDMYIIANLFNGSESESWYKISRVVIARKKLTCNKIDNVRIYLDKSEAL